MKKTPRTSRERMLRGTLDGPSRTIEVEPVKQPIPAPSPPPAAPPEREPERTPVKTRRG